MGIWHTSTTYTVHYINDILGYLHEYSKGTSMLLSTLLITGITNNTIINYGAFLYRAVFSDSFCSPPDEGYK